MYYSPETKSSPVFVGVTERPTFIVGQNIGHEPDGSHTGVVWEKNRSAQLLWEAIDSSENIFLTNVCNYTEMTPEHMQEGFYDLKQAVNAMLPKKIICLGKIAKAVVAQIKPPHHSMQVVNFPHPSFVIRFDKDREIYVNSISKELQ